MFSSFFFFLPYCLLFLVLFPLFFPSLISHSLSFPIPFPHRFSWFGFYFFPFSYLLLPFFSFFLSFSFDHFHFITIHTRYHCLPFFLSSILPPPILFPFLFLRSLTHHYNSHSVPVLSLLPSSHTSLPPSSYSSSWDSATLSAVFARP